MRLRTFKDGIQELTLSIDDTLRWKTRFYPASVVADKRVWIKFDVHNHVIDYTVDGVRGVITIPLEELDALSEEFLNYAE